MATARRRSCSRRLARRPRQPGNRQAYTSQQACTPPPRGMHCSPAAAPPRPPPQPAASPQALFQLRCRKEKEKRWLPMLLLRASCPASTSWPPISRQADSTRDLRRRDGVRVGARGCQAGGGWGSVGWAETPLAGWTVPEARPGCTRLPRKRRSGAAAASTPRWCGQACALAQAVSGPAVEIDTGQQRTGQGAPARGGRAALTCRAGPRRRP